MDFRFCDTMLVFSLDDLLCHQHIFALAPILQRSCIHLLNTLIVVLYILPELLQQRLAVIFWDNRVAVTDQG